MILSLYHGSGCLTINCDEFKGFHEKYLKGAQNISALTSAYSGETISYTTVKRGITDIWAFGDSKKILILFVVGNVCVYDHLLNIYGCIQPEGLVRAFRVIIVNFHMQIIE